MKASLIVEAALFSAGRAIAVEEIMEETGLSKQSVNKAIKELQKIYEERETVLEIGKAGTKWAMQVRRQAADDAARFAPMEIPKKVLKTLALIAYHQPIKQSELGDMIGSKVYDHVSELKERGLIKTRRDGQTKILSTTAAFPEYFGLDAATPDQIRTTLAKAVGLDPRQAKKRPEEDLQEYKTTEQASEASDDGAPQPLEHAAESNETTGLTPEPDSESLDDGETSAVAAT